MTEQASIQGDQARPPGSPGADRESAGQPLRALGIAAVCLGVAALAGATFVLSYSGIHAVARQAGITPHYARDYPLLIDAMLVIALLAVLGLRGAGMPSRVLAWLTLLVVLSAAAGADVLHATGRALPHNVGAATAAALPWALVLIAFVLLLALLRNARLRRHTSAARRRQDVPARETGRTDAGRPVAARPEPLPVRIPRQWDSDSIVPGFRSQLVSSAAAGAAAAATAVVPEPASFGTASDAPAGGQATQELGSGPEATDNGAAEEGTSTEPPAEVGEQSAEAGPTDGGFADAASVDAGSADAEDAIGLEEANETTQPAASEPAAEHAGTNSALAADSGDLPTSDAVLADQQEQTGDLGPAHQLEMADQPGPADPAADDPVTAAQQADELATAGQGDGDALADGMPVFHRMWSTPTPPDS